MFGLGGRGGGIIGVREQTLEGRWRAMVRAIVVLLKENERRREDAQKVAHQLVGIEAAERQPALLVGRPRVPREAPHDVGERE